MIYSLLSEKAMFVHKLYLNSLPMHQPLSCQEVLLSLQVAAISHKPPVAVVSHPRVLLDDASAEMHQSKSSLRRGKQDSERKREKQCVQEWIQASGMKNLPTEMSKYIGSRWAQSFFLLELHTPWTKTLADTSNTILRCRHFKPCSILKNWAFPLFLVSPFRNKFRNTFNNYR